LRYFKLDFYCAICGLQVFCRIGFLILPELHHCQLSIWWMRTLR
jgi:hypothetical protein